MMRKSAMTVRLHRRTRFEVKCQFQRAVRTGNQQECKESKECASLAWWPVRWALLPVCLDESAATVKSANLQPKVKGAKRSGDKEVEGSKECSERQKSARSPATGTNLSSQLRVLCELLLKRTGTEGHKGREEFKARKGCKEERRAGENCLSLT